VSSAARPRHILQAKPKGGDSVQLNVERSGKWQRELKSPAKTVVKRIPTPRIKQIHVDSAQSNVKLSGKVNTSLAKTTPTGRAENKSSLVTTAGKYDDEGPLKLVRETSVTRSVKANG
jgi:hypothetical protein